MKSGGEWNHVNVELIKRDEYLKENLIKQTVMIILQHAHVGTQELGDVKSDRKLLTVHPGGGKSQGKEKKHRKQARRNTGMSDTLHLCHHCTLYKQRICVLEYRDTQGTI